MDALSLYARYALRSFIRGRSRSLFGAFCVAVGVASAVALGLAGGNFQDAVTGNAQQLNRGDVSLSLPQNRISLKDYRYFADLKRRGLVTDYTPVLRVDTMIKRATGDQTNTMIGGAVAVEGNKFPFYDTIKADNPSGVPLTQLLRPRSGGPYAVVSHTVFDQLHLQIGGLVQTPLRYGGILTFRVAGIVPDNAPDPGFGGGLFPYWVIFDRSAMLSYIKGNDNAASQVYMKTRNAAQAAVVKSDIVRRFGGLYNPKTVADVERDSASGAEGFNKFFRIMSLIAIVIGGIGIINTMLVAARRRVGEIAVLKSIGMKGRQVVLVFLVETLILGVAGTVVGLALGIAASAVVSNVVQGLAGYPIPWSLHARPLIAGTIIGIIATVLFSYLPVVRASRVRPIVALRDEHTGPARVSWLQTLRRSPGRTVLSGVRSLPRGMVRLPRRSGFRSTLLVLLLAAVMGYLAILYTALNSGIQTVIVGVIAGIATLVIAAVLIQIFVLLVWLVSKLPSFGRLSPRMAFRSMGTQKRRLGSTLLALCVGILAVGSIAILAQNLKTSLAQSLEQHQNFNVVVQFPHNPSTHAQVMQVVNGLPGIQHRDIGAIANLATLSSVDGAGVKTLIGEALAGRNPNHKKYSKDDVSQAVTNSVGVGGHDLRVSADNWIMKSGRNLNASDSGTNHAMVGEDIANVFQIRRGSHLIYTDGSRRFTVVVVGIASQQNFTTTSDTVLDARYMQKVGLTTPSPSHNELVFLRIAHGDLKSDVAKLRTALPHALVLDLDSFLEFTQIVDKVALFPEIIGGLALFAGVIIIANTVALAMLERRREIGIMKAVGARRRTILQFLLVENAIVGFLGAGMGVLLAMLASAIFAQNVIGISASFDWTTPILLILVGMVLAILASALTALPASSEKPMSVLRYE